MHGRVHNVNVDLTNRLYGTLLIDSAHYYFKAIDEGIRKGHIVFKINK